MALAGCSSAADIEADPARQDQAAANTAISLAVAVDACGTSARPADWTGCESDASVADRADDIPAEPLVAGHTITGTVTGWTVAVESGAGTEYIVERTGGQIELTCAGDGERCEDGRWHHDGAAALGIDRNDTAPDTDTTA